MLTGGAVQAVLFRVPGDHVLTMHPRHRNARGELARPSGSCPCGWISARHHKTADEVSVEFAQHVRRCAP